MATGQSDRDYALSAEQLNAFADGQLPQPLAQQVAHAIRQQPGHAEQIYQYWIRERALHQSIAGAFNRAPPLQISDPVLDQTESDGAPRGAMAVAAAALLMTVMVGGYHWFERGSEVAPQPSQLALQWFQNAPLANISPMEASAQFSELGLQPQGQQVVHFADQPWLEMRFETSNNIPLALYKGTTNSADSGAWLRVFSSGQMPLAEWNAQGNRYVLVGGNNSLDVANLAVSMRASLMAPPSTGDEMDAPMEHRQPADSDYPAQGEPAGTNNLQLENGVADDVSRYPGRPADLRPVMESPVSTL